jgi:hypothetical protein
MWVCVWCKCLCVFVYVYLYYVYMYECMCTCVCVYKCVCWVCVWCVHLDIWSVPSSQFPPSRSKPWRWWGWQERGLSSLWSAKSFLSVEPGDRELCLFLMYSHAGYVPHAYPQLHHKMKLHILLILGSYTTCKHFLGILYIIHKDMKHF